MLIIGVFVISLLISCFVFTGWNIGITINHTKIGILPIILIGVYLLFLIFSWFNDKADPNETADNYVPEKHTHKEPASVKLSILLLFIYSFGLIVFALLLNAAADLMVKPHAQGGYNLEPHTIGGIILSWVMATPEILSLFLLVNKGLVSMGMSAILGAQIFNFSILFFADVFYKRGPILKETLSDHSIRWISLTITIVTFIFLLKLIFGKIFKDKTKALWFHATASCLIVVSYLVSWILIIIL